MKRTMKFLLTTMFAAMMVPAFVSIAAAQETVWLSTSGPGVAPGAAPASGNDALSLSGSVGSSQTLYIWSTAGTPITPSTSYPAQGTSPSPFPTNVPPSSAAFAYDLTSTGAGSGGAFSITAAQIFNPNVLTAGGATQTGDQSWAFQTGAVSPADQTITRWNAASSFTTANAANLTATSVTGLDASALPVGLHPGGVDSAINTSIATGLAPAAAASVPYYLTSAQNGGNGAVFLIGSVTFTINNSGSASLSVAPSNSVGGGSSFGVGSLTSTYNGTAWVPTSPAVGASAFNNGGGSTNFAAGTGTATLTISTGPVGRLGDLNNDNAINAADLDQLGADIRNGLTYAQAAALGRNDNLLNNPNQNALVSTADMDHEVGSLVDINGGGAGGLHGTHYGDSDLNGIVNQLDLNSVNSHWQQSGFGWANGNFNEASATVVNQLDLNLVNANWQKSGGDGQLSVVPEPSSLILMVFGVTACFAARRVSRRREQLV